MEGKYDPPEKARYSMTRNRTVSNISQVGHTNNLKRPDHRKNHRWVCPPLLMKLGARPRIIASFYHRHFFFVPIQSGTVQIVAFQQRPGKEPELHNAYPIHNAYPTGEGVPPVPDSRCEEVRRKPDKPKAKQQPLSLSHPSPSFPSFPLLPFRKHLLHVDRSPAQRLLLEMRVDIRGGLVIQMASRIHREV